MAVCQRVGDRISSATLALFSAVLRQRDTGRKSRPDAASAESRRGVNRNKADRPRESLLARLGEGRGQSAHLDADRTAMNIQLSTLLILRTP